MSTRTLTETELELAKMWRENTGTHILDSGGAYGRNWTRNQNSADTAEAFAEAKLATPEAYFDSYTGVTLNTFALCATFLEFQPDLQAEFDAYADEQPDEAWFPLMQEYAEGAHAPKSDYNSPQVWNTYNWETLIDETLQGVTFELNDGETYALVQYHGGCDVRGGYTRPRVFKFLGYNGADVDFMIALSDAYINIEFPDGSKFHQDVRGGVVDEVFDENFETISDEDEARLREVDLFVNLGDQEGRDEVTLETGVKVSTYAVWDA